MSSFLHKPLLGKFGVITAVVAPFVAPLVFAEGGVRLIDCQVTQQCDSEGVCAASSEMVNFRLEPESIDADGAGRFQLTLDGVKSSMQALSSTGPFIWNSETARNVLLISSETRFLWHRLELDAGPNAIIRYMTCSFIQ